jgi:hypothetical protein
MLTISSPGAYQEHKEDLAVAPTTFYLYMFTNLIKLQCLLSYSVMGQLSGKSIIQKCYNQKSFLEENSAFSITIITKMMLLLIIPIVEFN